MEGDDFSSACSPDDQWRSVTIAFQQRKVLLVWDNFESTLPASQNDSEDSPLSFTADDRNRLVNLYRRLTAGNPQGRLLITCRPEETGLPGIKQLPLAGLARYDSLYLLNALLDQKSITINRPGYDRDAIDALLKALDDH